MQPKDPCAKYGPLHHPPSTLQAYLCARVRGLCWSSQAGIAAEAEDARRQRDEARLQGQSVADQAAALEEEKRAHGIRCKAAARELNVGRLELSYVRFRCCLVAYLLNGRFLES